MNSPAKEMPATEMRTKRTTLGDKIMYKILIRAVILTSSLFCKREAENTMLTDAAAEGDSVALFHRRELDTGHVLHLAFVRFRSHHGRFNFHFVGDYNNKLTITFSRMICIWNSPALILRMSSTSMFSICLVRSITRSSSVFFSFMA